MPARHLGTIEIANDNTGTRQTGNYMVRFAKFNSPGQTWRRGTVSGFDRVKRGPYDLLLAALLAVVGPRNIRFIDEMNAERIDGDEAP
ncbi:hypothetical protein [Paraburkholderia sediminicola]|uniref:hypothetical protein n=1 Tax=Paraburkholderia sediminicola TaxID=458836 RepID=UPI0038B85380